MVKLPRICPALYPRCDPRGSRQPQLVQPRVADSPLARAACGRDRPSHRRSQHRGYNASHAIKACNESVMWLGLEGRGVRNKKRRTERKEGYTERAGTLEAAPGEQAHKDSARAGAHSKAQGQRSASKQLGHGRCRHRRAGAHRDGVPLAVAYFG